MTKISIDVDFNKDPEVILKEIQEKAKTEVERREKKERSAAHLEILHNQVNEAIGTSFNNVNELIRALAVYATPTLQGRILGVTSSGRRKTVTMTKELYEKIKAGLAAGEQNKAKIAREFGVSSTQVTKVDRGGYDAKYGGHETSESPSAAEVGVEQLDPLAAAEEPVAGSDQAELSIPELEPKQEELSMPEPIADPVPAEPYQASEVGDLGPGSSEGEDASANMPEERGEDELESFGESRMGAPEQVGSEEAVAAPIDGPMPPQLEPNIPISQPPTPSSPFEPVAETEVPPLSEVPPMDQGEAPPPR